MNGLQETNVYAFSGLSNGEYDNLNADTINTQELYIDGVLFDVSGIDLTNYVTTTQLSTQLTPINNNLEFMIFSDFEKIFFHISTKLYYLNFGLNFFLYSFNKSK